MDLVEKSPSCACGYCIYLSIYSYGLSHYLYGIHYVWPSWFYITCKGYYSIGDHAYDIWLMFIIMIIKWFNDHYVKHYKQKNC